MKMTTIAQHSTMMQSMEDEVRSWVEVANAADRRVIIR
jgi:hypothetical protein